jgi:cell volume regulation protein A
MSAAIIIALCILLLIAYLFDITSPHTKVPSVILLLFLGWLVNQGAAAFKIPVPHLGPLLPLLGSVGLVLIVLEGALELELDRSRKKIIVQSVFSAFLPIVLLSFALGWLFHYYTGHPMRVCLINAVPLSVISSSVAISAGRNLGPLDREFVTYESSLSDIFGVLIFNFLIVNESLTTSAVLTFASQLLLVLVISFAATFLLSFLLSRINHHIKYAPIILLVILIYELSKVYHLPALIFILVFGLFLGNFEKLKAARWGYRLHPLALSAEVAKLKEIVAEATFLTRALFFLLFGFLIQTAHVLNGWSLLWSVAIVSVIYSVRAVILKVAGSPLKTLVFIAPRGLITILLYFAVEPQFRIELINESVILQVILLTSAILMLGMIATGKSKTVFSERHETGQKGT